MITQIEDFKKKLEEEKAALILQLEGVGRINPDNITDWEPVAASMDIDQAETGERAMEITSFEDRSAIEFELEEKLKEVHAALESIENNSYGICIVCASAIAEERLMANPSARTCNAHME